MHDLCKSHPVIICGDSGTISVCVLHKSFPKQFVPLIDNISLFQQTLERVEQVNSDSMANRVISVAAEDHRFLAAEAMQAAKVKGLIMLKQVECKEYSSHCGVGSFEGCT